MFLEAAACGLPVIAGNRDGSVDALAEGQIGTLIDPEDVGEIAAATIAALDKGTLLDPERVGRFRRGKFDEHVGRLVGEIETIGAGTRARPRAVGGG